MSVCAIGSARHDRASAMSLLALGPDGPICQVALGLTLYLENAPTSSQVNRAWEAYKSVCPKSRLSFVRTTRMFAWQPLSQPHAPDALTRFLVDQDERLDHGI